MILQRAELGTEKIKLVVLCKRVILEMVLLLYNKKIINDRFPVGRGIDMIKFRNPGLYKTQVQIFKELYKEYKNAPHFSLDDMKNTIAKTRLMTAYGYSGDTALALSNTKMIV